MNILNHQRGISLMFLCPVPLTLPKVTKSSEPEKELTPHVGFSRENSNQAGSDTPSAVTRTLHLPLWSQWPEEPPCMGLFSLQELSAASWIANYSTQSPLAPWGICLCHPGALLCSPVLPASSCFPCTLLLPLPVSHSLPTLQKWLFPGNALLLSARL